MIDDINDIEVYVSPRRYRTLSLAWDDGIAALARVTGSLRDDDVLTGQTRKGPVEHLSRLNSRR